MITIVPGVIDALDLSGVDLEAKYTTTTLCRITMYGLQRTYYQKTRYDFIANNEDNVLQLQGEFFFVQ